MVTLAQKSVLRRFGESQRAMGRVSIDEMLKNDEAASCC